MNAGQQFLDSGSSDSVQIVIDHRERPEFDALLQRHGAQTRRVQLSVGDFVCSARCVVERKTRSDFESSVIDGRLFSQLPHLRGNYARVILLVEGEESLGALSKEALLGAYTSLVTDYGVSLFFTRNPEKTAELIFAIAKHEQLAKKQPLRIYAKRKTLTLAQTQRSIVEMLPMVGPKLAQTLLRHFGSIDQLVSATERDLAEVPGLGKKRAKVIRNVLHASYSSNKHPEG